MARWRLSTCAARPPGTRGIDLLVASNLVQQVHIVLCGGSAFGLGTRYAPAVRHEY